MEHGYSSGPSLLLVAPDAGGGPGPAEAALKAALPGLAVTCCGSLDAARAYLAAASFDLVCVDAALPGNDGADAAALTARLGARVRVVVLDCVAAEPSQLRRALGHHSPAEPARGGNGDGTAILEEVRLSLGRAVHAANNPLTVIAGNAQFLLEVARAMELDPGFVRSLEDIDAAGRQLQTALAELAALRQRIAASLTTADALA